MHKSSGWSYKGERCKLIAWKPGNKVLIEIASGRHVVDKSELEPVKHVTNGLRSSYKSMPG
jgi:hypothetical protein